MAFVHIEGINLAEIAAGGLHQVQTVLFGLAQSFFMRQHGSGRKRLGLDPADKTLDLFHRAMVHPSSEFLFIDIQPRLGIPLQNARFFPGAQGVSRFFIGIFSLFGQFQPDDIAGIHPQIFLTLGFTDNIIGRTGQLADFSGFFRKTQSAEGSDFSHGCSLLFCWCFCTLLLYWINTTGSRDFLFFAVTGYAKTAPEGTPERLEIAF